MDTQYDGYGGLLPRALVLAGELLSVLGALCSREGLSLSDYLPRDVLAAADGRGNQQRPAGAGASSEALRRHAPDADTLNRPGIPGASNSTASAQQPGRADGCSLLPAAASPLQRASAPAASFIPFNAPSPHRLRDEAAMDVDRDVDGVGEPDQLDNAGMPALSEGGSAAAADLTGAAASDDVAVPVHGEVTVQQAQQTLQQTHGQQQEQLPQLDVSQQKKDDVTSEMGEGSAGNPELDADDGDSGSVEDGTSSGVGEEGEDEEEGEEDSEEADAEEEEEDGTTVQFMFVRRGPKPWMSSNVPEVLDADLFEGYDEPPGTARWKRFLKHCHKEERRNRADLMEFFKCSRCPMEDATASFFIQGPSGSDTHQDIFASDSDGSDADGELERDGEDLVLVVKQRVKEDFGIDLGSDDDSEAEDEGEEEPQDPAASEDLHDGDACTSVTDDEVAQNVNRAVRRTFGTSGIAQLRAMKIKPAGLLLELTQAWAQIRTVAGQPAAADPQEDALQFARTLIPSLHAESGAIQLYGLAEVLRAVAGLLESWSATWQTDEWPKLAAKSYQLWHQAHQHIKPGALGKAWGGWQGATRSQLQEWQQDEKLCCTRLLELCAELGKQHMRSVDMFVRDKVRLTKNFLQPTLYDILESRFKIALGQLDSPPANEPLPERLQRKSGAGSGHAEASSSAAAAAAATAAAHADEPPSAGSEDLESGSLGEGEEEEGEGEETEEEASGVDDFIVEDDEEEQDMVEEDEYIDADALQAVTGLTATGREKGESSKRPSGTTPKDVEAAGKAASGRVKNVEGLAPGQSLLLVTPRKPGRNADAAAGAPATQLEGAANVQQPLQMGGEEAAGIAPAQQLRKAAAIEAAAELQMGGGAGAAAAAAGGGLGGSAHVYGGSASDAQPAGQHGDVDMADGQGSDDVEMYSAEEGGGEDLGQEAVADGTSARPQQADGQLPRADSQRAVEDNVDEGEGGSGAHLQPQGPCAAGLEHAIQLSGTQFLTAGCAVQVAVAQTHRGRIKARQKAGPCVFQTGYVIQERVEAGDETSEPAWLVIRQDEPEVAEMVLASSLRPAQPSAQILEQCRLQFKHVVPGMLLERENSEQQTWEPLLVFKTGAVPNSGYKYGPATEADRENLLTADQLDNIRFPADPCMSGWPSSFLAYAFMSTTGSDRWPTITPEEVRLGKVRACLVYDASTGTWWRPPITCAMLKNMLNAWDKYKDERAQQMACMRAGQGSHRRHAGLHREDPVKTLFQRQLARTPFCILKETRQMVCGSERTKQTLHETPNKPKKMGKRSGCLWRKPQSAATEAGDGAARTRRRKGRAIESTARRKLRERASRAAEKAAERKEHNMMMRIQASTQRLQLDEASLKGSKPLFADRQDPVISGHFMSVLKEHQLDGLRFLWRNLVDAELEPEDQQGGVILAHIMGLGKSLTTMVLLYTYFSYYREHGRVLLVVPANVLYNFYQEFCKWLPNEEGSAMTPDKVYLCSNRKTALQKVPIWYKQHGSVLIMSSQLFSRWIQYQDAASECPANQALAGEGATAGGDASTPNRDVTPHLDAAPSYDGDVGVAAADAAEAAQGLDAAATQAGIAAQGIGLQGQAGAATPVKPGQGKGPRKKLMSKEEIDILNREQQALKEMLLEGPTFVVADEAHELKNHASQYCKALSQVHTWRRLALTGYPLQNNLREYYTMINWVRPNKELGSFKDFEEEFVGPIDKGRQTTANKRDKAEMKYALALLKTLTDPFVQAVGDSVLKEELRRANVTKTEHVLRFRLTPEQGRLYNAYAEILARHAVPRSLFKDQHIFNKICNTPSLLEDFLTSAKPGTDLAQGVEVEDAEDIALLVTPSEPNAAMQTDAAAGTAAAAAGMSQQGAAQAAGAAEGAQDVSARQAKGKRGRKPDNKRKNALDKLAESIPEVVVHDLLNVLQDIKAARAAQLAGEASSSSTASVTAWTEDPKMHFVRAMLMECQQQGEKLVLYSQNLNVLNLMMNVTIPQVCGTSVQRERGWWRIDGSVSAEQRSTYIRDFNTHQGFAVFLISTRAGAVGINLTSAQRLIVFDVPWNPVHNAQAIARIHRIGQTKPTFVYRLMYAGTSEEAIYTVNLDKEELSHKVIDQKSVRKQTELKKEHYIWQQQNPMSLQKLDEQLKQQDVLLRRLLLPGTEELPLSKGGQVNQMRLQAEQRHLHRLVVNYHLHQAMLPEDPLEAVSRRQQLKIVRHYCDKGKALQSDPGRKGKRLLRLDKAFAMLAADATNDEPDTIEDDILADLDDHDVPLAPTQQVPSQNNMTQSSRPTQPLPRQNSLSHRNQQQHPGPGPVRSQAMPQNVRNAAVQQRPSPAQADVQTQQQRPLPAQADMQTQQQRPLPAQADMQTQQQPLVPARADMQPQQHRHVSVGVPGPNAQLQQSQQPEQQQQQQQVARTTDMTTLLQLVTRAARGQPGELRAADLKNALDMVLGIENSSVQHSNLHSLQQQLQQVLAAQQHKHKQPMQGVQRSNSAASTEQLQQQARVQAQLLQQQAMRGDAPGWPQHEGEVQPPSVQTQEGQLRETSRALQAPAQQAANQPLEPSGHVSSQPELLGGEVALTTVSRQAERSQAPYAFLVDVSRVVATWPEYQQQLMHFSPADWSTLHSSPTGQQFLNWIGTFRARLLTASVACKPMPANPFRLRPMPPPQSGLPPLAQIMSLLIQMLAAHPVAQMVPASGGADQAEDQAAQKTVERSAAGIPADDIPAEKSAGSKLMAILAGNGSSKVGDGRNAAAPTAAAQDAPSPAPEWRPGIAPQQQQQRAALHPQQSVDGTGVGSKRAREKSATPPDSSGTTLVPPPPAVQVLTSNASGAHSAAQGVDLAPTPATQLVEPATGVAAAGAAALQPASTQGREAARQHAVSQAAAAGSKSVVTQTVVGNGGSTAAPSGTRGQPAEADTASSPTRIRKRKAGGVVAGTPGQAGPSNGVHPSVSPAAPFPLAASGVYKTPPLPVLQPRRVSTANVARDEEQVEQKFTPVPGVGQPARKRPKGTPATEQDEIIKIDLD